MVFSLSAATGGVFSDCCGELRLSAQLLPHVFCGGLGLSWHVCVSGQAGRSPPWEQEGHADNSVEALWIVVLLGSRHNKVQIYSQAS